MKQTMRKLLAITVMMATLLSTTMVVAQAEEEFTTKDGGGAYTVVIKNPSDSGISIVDDIFHAYQIFAADDVTSYSVTEDFRDFFIGTKTGGDGSNTTYDFGQYLTTIDAFEEEYTTYDPEVTYNGDTSPTNTQVATYNTALDNYNQLAGAYMNSYASNMYALAIEMRDYLDSVGAHVVGDGGITCLAHAKGVAVDGADYETATLTGLDSGYYFIFDQESTMNGLGIAASGAFMPLTTSSDTITYIEVKQSIPTMTKTIYHDDEEKWDIVGDSQIGDKVEFRVISTLPTNIEDYIDVGSGLTADGEVTSGVYTYTLTDTMSAGLTYNGDVVIYTDEGTTPVGKEYYEVTAGQNADGETINGFFITFNAISFLTDYPDAMTLYTYYSATLNDKAVVASDYDENTAVLEYSFNPADETDIGSTESSILHYTFALDVNKVDESGNGLAGAKFGLFDKEGNLIPLTQGETDTDGVVSYYYDLAATDGYITTTAGGQFTIYGLNDQTLYTLREVEAPDGYNASDAFDIYFTVTYDALGTEITYLTDGSAYVNTAYDAVTGDWSSTSTIVNRLKIYLPETGGMGTVLFQVGGGALMLGAVAMLLVNKRKKEET